jgi:hypothetical protein
LKSAIVDIILRTADQGCGSILQTEYAAMGAFYVLMHATPVIITFLLLSVHHPWNLIQAISGLLLHVVMICRVESPSGSFLRSMGKLGLDWIGYGHIFKLKVDFS